MGGGRAGGTLADFFRGASCGEKISRVSPSCGRGRSATLAVAAVAVAVGGTTLSGCLAYQVVSAPVKVAGAAVVAVGETAGAVVTTTGKVAVSAVKAAGAIGSGGLDAAARLGQAGLVTFADTATGTVVRVPWAQGLTLASASQTARVSMAQRAVEVVRAGKIVYAATRPAGEGAVLASGDVVRLRK